MSFIRKTVYFPQFGSSLRMPVTWPSSGCYQAMLLRQNMVGLPGRTVATLKQQYPAKTNFSRNGLSSFNPQGFSLQQKLSLLASYSVTKFSVIERGNLLILIWNRMRRFLTFIDKRKVITSGCILLLSLLSAWFPFLFKVLMTILAIAHGVHATTSADPRQAVIQPLPVVATTFLAITAPQLISGPAIDMSLLDTIRAQVISILFCCWNLWAAVSMAPQSYDDEDKWWGSWQAYGVHACTVEEFTSSGFNVTQYTEEEGNYCSSEYYASKGVDSMSWVYNGTKRGQVDYFALGGTATLPVAAKVRIPKFTMEGEYPKIDDYYKIKRNPPEVQVSPSVDPNSRLPQQYRALCQLIEDKPLHYIQRLSGSSRGQAQILPISDYTSVGIQTGYSLISAGKYGPRGQVQPFEYHSSSLENLACAMHRQISGNTQCDKLVLQDFSTFVSSELQPLRDQAHIAATQYQFKSLLEYPSEAFSNEPSKRSKYEINIQLILTGAVRMGAVPFKVMVKQGEVWTGYGIEDEMGYFEHDSRPRNICVPQGRYYSYQAAVQSQCWDIIKDSKVYPWFMHGHTTEDIQEFAQVQFGLGRISVSADGSQFDSTQYAELQTAVDLQVWTALTPYLNQVLSGSNTPTGHSAVSATDKFLSVIANRVNNLVYHIPGIGNYYPPSEADKQIIAKVL